MEENTLDATRIRQMTGDEYIRVHNGELTAANPSFRVDFGEHKVVGISMHAANPEWVQKLSVFFGHYMYPYSKFRFARDSRDVLENAGNLGDMKSITVAPQIGTKIPANVIVEVSVSVCYTRVQPVQPIRNNESTATDAHDALIHVLQERVQELESTAKAYKNITADLVDYHVGRVKRCVRCNCETFVIDAYDYTMNWIMCSTCGHIRGSCYCRDCIALTHDCEHIAYCHEHAGTDSLKCQGCGVIRKGCETGHNADEGIGYWCPNCI
jgi:hypothetical protein